MLINFEPLPEKSDSYVRTHPWTITDYEGRQGFYTNFIEHPEQIPQVLEDFKPHDHQPGVKCFYGFLQWINGAESFLETNDCALSESVVLNPDRLIKRTHKIEGRVELFIREHALNANNAAVTWLFRMLSFYLQIQRPNFYDGFVTLQLAPTSFVELADQSDGHRIRLTFNAYGDGEDDTWAALSIVFSNIWEATKRLNQAMTEGDTPTFP